MMQILEAIAILEAKGGGGIRLFLKYLAFSKVQSI